MRPLKIQINNHRLDAFQRHLLKVNKFCGVYIEQRLIRKLFIGQEFTHEWKRQMWNNLK